GRADAPGVPIEDAYIIAAVARQEAVPDMRIAVDEREMAVRVVALRQARRRLEETLIEITAFGRQPVAKLIAKEAELVPSVGDVLRGLVLGGPYSDRFAEPRVVPPGRVEARIGLQDALALRHGRRHRPGGGDRVR